MSERTAEERRAEVVRRVFRLIAVDAVAPAGTRPASVTAESIVSLLESGDAGVYLVAGADAQGTVGIVLGQLREARAEVERLRIVETASIGAHALLADAEEEVRQLTDALGRRDPDVRTVMAFECGMEDGRRAPMAENERLRALLGEVAADWVGCARWASPHLTPHCGECLPCRIRRERAATPREVLS